MQLHLYNSHESLFCVIKKNHLNIANAAALFATYTKADARCNFVDKPQVILPWEVIAIVTKRFQSPEK
jgi:hypothetical protein